MEKALIIVQGTNSPTKKFGEAIAEFLLYRGLSAELIPIDSFEPKNLKVQIICFLAVGETVLYSHPNTPIMNGQPS